MHAVQQVVPQPCKRFGAQLGHDGRSLIGSSRGLGGDSRALQVGVLLVHNLQGGTVPAGGATGIGNRAFVRKEKRVWEKGYWRSLFVHIPLRNGLHNRLGHIHFADKVP